MLAPIVALGLACLSVVAGGVVSSETETVPVVAPTADTKDPCNLYELDKEIEEVTKSGSIQAILRAWQQYYQCKDTFRQGVEGVFGSLANYELQGLDLLTERVRAHDPDLEHNLFLDLSLTWNALKNSIQSGCLDYLATVHSIQLESGEEAVAKVSQILCVGVNVKLRPILSLLSEMLGDMDVMNSVEPILKYKLSAARLCQRIVQSAALDAKTTRLKAIISTLPA